MKLWFPFFIFSLAKLVTCNLDGEIIGRTSKQDGTMEDYETWGLEEYGGRFSNPAAEAEEEKNDNEILKAVIDSMFEWEFNKANKHHKRTKRDEEVVCYQDVGCFRDEGPFDYLDMLPSPPEEIGTKFLLFTRHNPGRPEVLQYTSNTTKSHFNSSLPTKIIIHGFGSSCQHFWALEMRESLLNQIDCNVICVDWEKGAELPNYVRAAVNTRLVGRQVGLLMTSLLNLSSSIDQFHLIGFSLGAHVTGFAGDAILEMHKKLLPRITGLDPAGPLFESYSPQARLDSNDAQFVDVIHSNGESLIMGGLGAWEQMGDVDFYPNGGRAQRGCSNLFWGSITDMFWWGGGRYIRKAKELLNRFNPSPNTPPDARMASEIEGRGLCNHRRAYKFFTYSIAPKCTFPSFQCDTYEQFLVGDCFPCGAKGVKCTNMGYYSDKTEATGKLYLVTRETEPFCAHQFKVSLVGSYDQEPTYGKLEFIFIGTKGYNETFTMTRDDKEELIPGSKWTKILVPHPIVGENFKIQVRYTAYKGWLYSGKPTWTLQHILLMDSYGEISSYCSEPLIMETGEAKPIITIKGGCNADFVALKPNRDELPDNEVTGVVPGGLPHSLRTPINGNRYSTPYVDALTGSNGSKPHVYGFYANVRFNNKLNPPETNQAPLYPRLKPYSGAKLPLESLLQNNSEEAEGSKGLHVIKLFGLQRPHIPKYKPSPEPQMVLLLKDEVTLTDLQDANIDQVYIIFSNSNNTKSPSGDTELTRKWLLKPDDSVANGTEPPPPQPLVVLDVDTSPPPQTRYYDIPDSLQNHFPQFTKSTDQLRFERPSIFRKPTSSSRAGKFLRFFAKSVESLPFISSHFSEPTGARSSRSQMMDSYVAPDVRELTPITDTHVDRYIPLLPVRESRQTPHRPNVETPPLKPIPR